MLKQKMAAGALWLSAAKLVVNLLAAISTLLLARLLTPDDFGLVAIGLTVLTVIVSVSELSLASALVQRRDLEDDHFHTAWTLGVLRALIIAAIMAGLAPVIAKIYDDPRLTWIVWALSLVILLNGASNPKTIVFLKNLEFWQEFVQTIAQKLLSFVVCIGIAYYYQSFWALVAGTVAGQLSGTILSYVFYPYRPKFSLAKWRDLISFSVWLSFSQIINTLSWRLDPLLIGYRLGSTTLGHYTVGDNLAGLPTRELAGPIERTLFPGFSAINDDKPRLTRAYTAAQTMLTAIALPAGVGFACIAEPFVSVAMGPQWLPVVPVIQVMSIVTALLTLGSPGYTLAMALGHTRWLFFRDLASMFIRLPIVIFGLYAGGLIGLLAGRAIAATISIGMNLYIVRYLLGLSILRQAKDNLRAISSALLMSAVLVVVQRVFPEQSGGLVGIPVVNVMLLTVLGAAVYSASMGGMWLLADKPEGPESTFISMAKVLLAKVQRRWRPA